MTALSGIIHSLRPQQWIKNLFLFAGVVFARKFFDLKSLLLATGGFVAFCILASGVYLLNDVKDIEADRAHPDKRKRPIASGVVPKPLAIIVAIVFIVIGSALSAALDVEFLYFAVGYIVLQMLYIFVFKNQPILDIISVAAGFVLRAAAGGVVVNVPISSWLLVCTSLLALFLVTEKRRQELSRIMEDAREHHSRPNLKNYTVKFLDDLSLVEISATIVAYTFYVFSPEVASRFGGYKLGFTIPFVFYGLLRYLWLSRIKGEGESPERIFFTDAPSIINIICWAFVAFLVIYLS